MITVLKTAEWLEHHLHEDIPSTLLTEITEYSTRHLHTLFRKYASISVAGYIRKRRLTLASVMLRETKRSVTEIALMYQFDHLQTFSRAFKKQFGISPLQYRSADSWNMNYYYPSLVVKSFTCRVKTYYFNNDLFLTSENRLLYKLNYGYDFFIRTEDRKIDSYPQVYKDCIHLIFENNHNFPFIISGEVLPGEDSDAIIDIHTGHLTTDNNTQKVTGIPSGFYCCFTNTGTPNDLMKFLSWTKGHGMHQFKQVLRKGISFTIFNETDMAGIYKADCYIPCIMLTDSARP
ncbi:helix-turn-helix transcriptional regulator [Salmonella enterica]|nr:helix-turn-helix transcriptional regulator [Salmonella enterica]ECY4645536.1 helix-turn-helix transcriptional regulator [Salmonella enterica subsp. enterica serovar Eastbourne]EDV0774432.1 helix-turn-helix transcriptional regulator [Salmonella enterica subsp. enterica]EIN0011893.1 helix-turn-helix transcriptional regulator [Salmonella enterica]EME6384568.1 helix-turn-helix transcriptional regulator [Salmonella enterica]